MKKITIEDVWRVFPNKYEAIVVASREARRLARIAREKKLKLPKKPTVLSMEKLIRGEIRYRYFEKKEREAE